MISVKKDFDKIPKGLSKKNPERYKDKSVINELLEIYRHKCACCEQKLNEGPMYPCIQHYRPLSTYPWLSYEWSNLLIVCKMCDVSAGGLFPLDPREGKQVTESLKDKTQWRADSESLLGEKPLLLHPEIDTPENHLYFDAEGIAQGRTDRGRETIRVFNLNRMDLIDRRKSGIKMFRDKFKEIFIDDFIKFNWKIGDNLYLKDRFICDILFSDIFEELKQAGEPQNEFSLLYRNILEYFHNTIIAHCLTDLEKDSYSPEMIKAYEELLKIAIVHFTKSDDVIRLGQEEKIVPIFPPKNTKDLRMEKGLPIALKKFEIQKYHGIHYTCIEKLPVNTRWIFLTGENSSGKTLVLQALVIGLFGKKDDDFTLADDNCRIQIELKDGHDNWISTAGGAFWGRIPNFTAYGPGRLTIDGDIFEGKQAPGKLYKTDSIFQKNSSLYNIQEYLTNIHGRKQFKNKYDALIKILKELLPHVEDIIVDDRAEKKKILYRERAENGDILKEVPIGALSAGSKSIIAMIGDMLIELSQTQDISDPAKLEGIVIIDEIDIHLHAKWQREFVIRLTNIFPKIQFIASTHSPIPLLGAPAETVILNVEKETKKEGIVVKRLNIDVTELTPNTILTSPIFNFDFITSQARRENELIYTDNDYSEVVFNKMLDEKLNQLAEKRGTSMKKLAEEDNVDKSK